MPGLSDDVDQQCEDIADSMGQDGLDMMMGLCGNAGQEAIIDNASDDYLSLCEDAASGDAGEFSTDHDDAVGEIVDAGNEVIQAIADACAAIRDAADAGDVANALMDL